ncbi:MAG: family 16 glycoside hydrolase [Polyangiales bacterium]
MSDEAKQGPADDSVDAWPTVLEESFLENAEGWSFAATSKTPPLRHDTNGAVLTLPGGETSVAALWYDGRTFADLSLEVTVTVLAAQDPAQSYVGVSFRAKSDRDNYRVFLDATGFYRLTRRQANQSTPLVDWTEHPAIAKGVGQENRLRIVAEGEKISVFCNDAELVSLTDDAFRDGHIALQAQGGSPEVESATVFCFKNLALSAPQSA